MKTLILIVLMITSAIEVFSQSNTFPSSGNVGIGTTSPVTKLEVNGAIKSNSTNYNYYNVVNLSSYNINTWYPVVFAGYDRGGPVKFEIIRDNVHEDGVYYGTLHFVGTFDSYGWGNTNDQFEYRYDEWPTDVHLVSYVGHQGHGTHIIIYLKGGRHYYVKSNTQLENIASLGSSYTLDAGSNDFQITASPTTSVANNPPASPPSGGTEYIAWRKVSGNIALSTSGNILIGKSSQTNNSYRLDVNGNIRANKLVVNTTGADDVFDSMYRMVSLDSLDNYVKMHHHLPGISPATTMQKEGLNVGDTETKLLKKVEEFTLYLITLEKVINQQKAQLDLLNRQLEDSRIRQDTRIDDKNRACH